MPKERFSPEEARKEGQGVQAWAEGEARKRGDEHPSPEDYETASRAVDSIRNLNPEWADNLMEDAAKAKGWVDAIGIGPYKQLTQLFQKSWTESLYAADKKGKFSRNLALEDTRRRINKRIESLFKGKEHFLSIAKEIAEDFIESNKDKE